MSDNNHDSHNELEHQATAEFGETEAGEHHAGETETDEYLSVSPEQHELHASGLRNAVLRGDEADDHLHGARHNDLLDGGDGDDTLDGGDGDDVLIAGGHTDRGTNSIDGGAGDDVLVAGGTATRELHEYLRLHPEVADAVRGDGKLIGLLSLIEASPVTDPLDTSARAANTIAFHDGNGHDSVFNFHAEGDRIQIDRGVNGSDISDIESLVRHITVDGDDVSIDLGQSNSVTLVGVDVAHLSADNVLWA